MTGEFEWWDVKRLTMEPEGAYFQAIRSSYWVANSVGQVAVYREGETVMPQCNANKSIVDRILPRIPDAKGTMFLRLAWVPIDLNDYR